jgi:Carboxypeptidase regulatory-like domain
MTWRVLAVLVLSTCSVLAQSNGGTITGTVIDPDNNLIAAAAVYAKHIPSGKIFKTDSSRAGTYTFSRLPAGPYEISIPSIGFTFRPYTKNDIDVQPRQTVRSDISLEWSANLGTVGDDTFLTIRRRYAGLKGPTPRARDGRPDLTGMWNGSEDPKKEEAAALPWAVAIQKERIANDFKESPSKYCMPGEVFPSSPFLYKFVHTPTLLVQLAEDEPAYRQIFMDGRKHPENLDPTWKGHSIGRWEGDTLVVDTVGFNDRGWLTDGFPHTEKMHIVERYRRPDVAHLILDITIEDPGTFTKPWNLHMNWELAPGEELIEYICNENNQYRPK